MRYEQFSIEHFPFRDMHRREGFCRIDARKLPDGRVVVIATEQKDNPGMSITNAAQYVASTVCLHLDIDPHQLIWIEHYGYPAVIPALNPRSFDRVIFDSITPSQFPFFYHPTWTVMKPADWETLGLPIP